MDINHEGINTIVNEFSLMREVDAVLLGGSRSTDNYDLDSDYDLYVYTNTEIDAGKREKVIGKQFSYLELNNQYWETEDNGILKESDIAVDIIYRNLDWIDASLRRVVLECEASIGYSTCIWYNFINSKILFDRDGLANKLQKRYSVVFPPKLKQAIINKNYPLLRDGLPAYLSQIAKAVKRKDTVSIAHRVGALFESYFDIIFAINEMPHPGEKKIIRYLQTNASLLPEKMAYTLRKIMSNTGTIDVAVVGHINKLIDSLDLLLLQNNIQRPMRK